MLGAVVLGRPVVAVMSVLDRPVVAVMSVLGRPVVAVMSVHDVLYSFS
jgi:hypothetical protein